MKTDWIVYAIVTLAFLYAARALFFRKGKKGCCKKSCSPPPENNGPAKKHE